MIDQLCTLLKNLGETKAAVTLLEAMGRHAVSRAQCDELAKSFFLIKKYNSSVKWAEKSLALSVTNEERFAARENLANSYAHAFYPEKALNEIEILERVDSNNNDIKGKKAYCLFLLGRRDEAEKILRDLLADSKIDLETKVKIEFNLGTYELYRDNFLEGLYRFLFYGRKMDLWKKPTLPFKFWDGNPISGKTLIIRAEAGIGDEFINVRFVNHLKKLKVNPIWFTERKELAKIFNFNGYNTVTSLDEIKYLDPDAYWCHSMDIPVLLRLQYDNLYDGPYIMPTQKTNILKSNKLKIGLRWQGNPDYDNDLHRSVPLGEIWEIVKDLDADFYSLQRDDGAEDVYDFPSIVPLHENHLKTFDDTLSIIDELDIVITTCTSIAHAAASMGKKTYVLSPVSSYYIWCYSDKQPKSPWYGDNVKLLRQKRPRHWNEPLEELKKCLIGL